MSETIDVAAAGDAPLTIALPETGTLKSSFRSAEGVTPLAYHGISVSRTFMRFMDQLARAGSDEPTGVSVELTDLAPGTYDIAFEEMNRQRPTAEMMRNQNRMFSERRRVTVAAGETVEADLEYRPFDVEQLKGDHTLELTLTDSSGKPVAREWELTVTPERGKPPVTVGSGTTGADGRITLAGISTKFPSLYLTSGKTRVGRVTLDTTAKTTQLTQTLPPGAGDMAPDVVLTDAVTGKPVRLSDFRGQVVFIDFWAVWCGPCQAPMQHNSDVMARRAADWAGKAAVVAISCDEDLEVMKEHVAKKEWGKMRHLWAEEGGRGFETTAMRTYGVTGIPTALLIDATGRIVWRGHPASYNFEAEIDKLLAAATP
jgi:thiol-disulfide isomerase/thioredoxin